MALRQSVPFRVIGDDSYNRSYFNQTTHDVSVRYFSELLSGASFKNLHSIQNNIAVERYYGNERQRVKMFGDAAVFQQNQLMLESAKNKLATLITKTESLYSLVADAGAMPADEYRNSIIATSSAINLVFNDPKVVQLFAACKDIYASWGLDELGLGGISADIADNDANIALAARALEILRYAASRAKKAEDINNAGLISLIVAKENGRALTFDAAQLASIAHPNGGRI